MQLRFQEFDDFIVLFKPNGIRMHQVDEGQFGFVEAISEQLNKPLFLVHRLDKQTSGICIMAKSKTAAAGLSELFEKQQVQKSYYFLTNQNHHEKQFEVKTHIEKKQNHFNNNLSLPPNSETTFLFVEKIGSRYLWKAEPKTGKPHQIRLHASFSQIPVLGDGEHQGDGWYRLGLHATSIDFLWNGKICSFQSELPPSFRDFQASKIKNLFQDSLFNKQQLFSFDPSESIRLIHTESAYLRADIFGKVLWIYDYSKMGLSTVDVAEIQDFADMNHYELIIRHMIDRGAGVGGLEKNTLAGSGSVSEWTAKEEKINYQFRTDSGFSPGLFMDQRANRKWVQSQAKEKKVLNLFCYTAGFSVAAVLGHASKVTSVDVSKNFLEWSKANFRLNQVDPSLHEFFAQDCLLFLKGSIKRNRKWDLIICDPPSFGRSLDNVWKIERDISELADLLCRCLTTSGEILFTCNFEEWSKSDLIRHFSEGLPAKKYIFERIPLLSLDYGETDEIKNLMKGFILRQLPTST